MLDQMKTALEGAGVPVYDPGVKIGECKAPYAVIRALGVEALPATRGLLGRASYEALLIVPLARQGELRALAQSARAALSALPLRLQTITDQELQEAYRAAGCSLIYTQNIVMTQ